MICRSTFVGWLRLVLVPTLLMEAMTKSIARSKKFCPSVDCATICHEDPPNNAEFTPQECDRCCVWVMGGGDEHEETMSDRLSAMESSGKELRVMTGILLALVLLLVMAVIILFLHLTKRLPRRFGLPVSFRNKKDSDAKKEKSPKTNCNGVTANAPVTRLANHQSNSSPPNKRASFTRSTSLGNTDLEPQPRPFRVRQPSESTCPEEGSDVTPQGYDNLALSTSTIDTSSTLHNTSTASTDTLGATLSTNTLHTTLSSDPQLIANTRHNTRV